MSNTAVVNGQLTKTPPYAWWILVISFLASFVAPMCMFKVPPLAPWLMSEFSMDEATFGLLMSAMGILGVVLAFPTAFIVNRIGVKGTTLIAVGSLGVGSLLGAITDSLPVMMASRFIEGIGIGLVGVSAPAGISAWFPEDRRGLPLGIWGLWFPLGTLLMFTAAPSIANALGWRSVWWICFGVIVVAFVLYAAFFKFPEGVDENRMTATSSVSETFRMLKNRNIWLLGISFCMFALIMNGIVNTYFPLFLQQEWGYDAAGASWFTSVNNVAALIMIPLSGLVSDLLKKRRYVILAGWVVYFLCCVIGFRTGDTTMWIWAALITGGVGSAMITGATRATVPEIMGGSVQGTSAGMAVLQFFQQLGIVIGAPIYAAFLFMGWSMASWVTMIPLAVIGIIATLLMKHR